MQRHSLPAAEAVTEADTEAEAATETETETEVEPLIKTEDTGRVRTRDKL